MEKEKLRLLAPGEYILITFGMFLIGCLITGLIETSVVPMILFLFLGYFISNILFVIDQKRLINYRKSHPDYSVTPKERLFDFILIYWILPHTTIAILVYLATKYIHE